MAKPPHSISDHRLGADYQHDHGPDDFDHDHDHDFLDASGSAEPVNLISLGLDIGSSSTQVAFSRLTMGGEPNRDTLFLSPVAPTPFDIDGSIDEQRLRRIVYAAFQGAQLTPDDVETGVVILTGEAASRRNATAVAQLIAEDVGDLVCAAAGHHMEAMLSAHGSSAVEASGQDGGRRILVIDIGGATTKLALVDNGRVLHTAAIAAGGRLLVIDRDNRVTRLDPAGAQYAQKLGHAWGVGMMIDPDLRTEFAEAIADVITAVASGVSAHEDLAPLFLTAPLGDLGNVDGVMFAGGVGEYVYRRETRDFNDVGRGLGLALRSRIEDGTFPHKLLPPGEVIRATVLGASQHSVQLSGHTIFISAHADLLPCRNVPVIRPSIDLQQETIVPAQIAAAIERQVEAFDLEIPAGRLALALSWHGSPAYPRIRALAEGIAIGLSARIKESTPFYVLVDGDIALSLGTVLKQELAIASAVMVADGIEASDFDFVDIGRVRLPSNTVPVTIKSLLFGGAGRSNTAAGMTDR